MGSRYGHFGRSVYVFLCHHTHYDLAQKFREKQNKYDNDFHDKAQDSIINFETVKYFTAEKYEAARYLNSVAKYEKNQANTMSSMVLLNFVRQVILNATMCFALILCAYAVRRGDMTLGSWVAIMAWITQIFAPLNFLGSIYTGIVQALIDIRNLTEVLKEEPDIVDVPNAVDIPFFAETEAQKLENKNPNAHHPCLVFAPEAEKNRRPSILLLQYGHKISEIGKIGRRH